MSTGQGIALFGTSADPPSTGHRALLSGLVDHYPQVVTWASSNPFKQHGAPLALRAALLQALVDQLANPRLRLEQQLSSPRAIETLDRARALWPGSELVFVVGSDLVSQIPRWYQAQQLLGLGRLAVVPRQGWPLLETDLERLRQLGARVELLPLAIPASASSQIRHHPSPELVPPALWPELVKHNLYGAAAGGASLDGGGPSRAEGEAARSLPAGNKGAGESGAGTLVIPAPSRPEPLMPEPLQSEPLSSEPLKSEPLKSEQLMAPPLGARLRPKASPPYQPRP